MKYCDGREEACNYVDDGLFNVQKAAARKFMYRVNDNPIWRDIGGININYITEIAGLNNEPMQWGFINGRLIDDWYIIPLPNSYFFPDVFSKYRSIWHVHYKSNLIHCTCRTDKNEWWCNTCSEPVPIGIIFIARTEGIRAAK